jgi:hypothetical protein
MQPIAQNQKPLKAPVRFGATAGSGSGIDSITGAVDTAFRLFQNSRGKEMIVEDVVGFGLMRTVMDLRRNKMYGDDSWNIPAAAERFGREISSIFTDSILGGVIAYGMSRLWFDRKNQAFSQEFIQYPALELFQNIVNQSEGVKNAKTPEDAQKAFIEALSERMEKTGNSQARQQVLQDAWHFAPPERSTIENATSWFRANPNAAVFNEQAKKLMDSFQNGAKDFDLSLNTDGKKLQQVFQANDLLDDVNRFGRFMKNAWKNKASNAPAWQTIAKNAIERTRTAKNWSIPIGLAAGMGTTFVTPFISNFLTKKWFNIDYFPGESSLRKNQPQPNQAANTEKKDMLARYFPYVKQATQNGNPLPLALALAPLLAAFGCVDTYNRKFINPISGFKDGTLKKLFDFSKAAPFTSQQQMAAMFALLITSRLLSSRSDNEYKERIMDSAVGWGAWIVGTPLLKIGLSRLSDPKELFSASGGLKSREALEAFGSKALPSHIRIGIGSTLATMGILGFGAPYAGIKLTQWNEKRKQQRLPQPVQPLQNKALTAFPLQPQSPFSALNTANRLPAAPSPFSTTQPGWNAYTWQQPPNTPLA